MVILIEAIERIAVQGRHGTETGMALAAYSIRDLADFAIELEGEPCNEEATA